MPESFRKGIVLGEGPAPTVPPPKRTVSPTRESWDNISRIGLAIHIWREGGYDPWWVWRVGECTGNAESFFGAAWQAYRARRRNRRGCCC